MSLKLSSTHIPFLFLFISSLISHTISVDSNPKKPSQLEFLNDLKGCHKGDNIKGIGDLKKYLGKFGYLNYPSSKNQTKTIDNEFDDLLESAIKTYQLNFNLEATGSLDENTVSNMMMPRCGFADVVNGRSSMRSGKKKAGHGPNYLPHIVSHYAFYPGAPRWPPSKTHLTYGFLPDTPEDAIDAVVQAFSIWQSSTHFTFSRSQDYANADLKISFQSGDHGDGHPFDGPGGNIAHSFAPPDGRFHYDGDEEWGVGAVPDAFDLETSALHEIGHLLGLGHSSVEEAIMYPSISPGETKIDLNADDIQGIRALYHV